MYKIKRVIFFSLSLILLVGVLSFFGCKSSKAERTSYEIECKLDGNVIKGKESVEFYNCTENAFSELKFNLYANAFREGAKYPPCSTQYTSRAYPNGINYGGIEISSVKSEDESLNFSVCGEDMNILTVTLKEQVFPDERVKVDIEYAIELADTVARTGINAKTINLANFYPILCGIEDGAFYECVYYFNGDPYYSDCADYKVSFTCDKKYTLASSGQMLSESVEGNEYTATYTLRNARSFALVASEHFKVISSEVDGIKINYYYYDDGSPEKALKTAEDSVKYFSNTFGQYAYTHYSVVQTKFLQGGMEFPALVMISDGLEEKAYKEVIIHETAHQWWMAAVGNNEIKYGFLDEGLTEYSVVLFYENHKEYGYDRKTLVMSAEKTYKTFCTVYDKLFGTTNTTMLRSLNEYSGEYEYVNIAYIKPCIMYDYLRTTIGDDKFFNSLQNYYKNYKFKNATPDDLVGAFEKTGANSNGFFNSFFEGKVII